MVNEPVEKKIFANCIDPEEMRVAIVENGRLVELFVDRLWDSQRTGDIYKARVDSVLPGMNAAFVDLGQGRNAFLYLAEVKSMKIEKGQEIVVQISRAARKGKGARVTTRISLPGRYLVLVPGGNDVGVSRKIASEEREHLRAIGRKIRPEGFGLIVRTAAVGTDEEFLLKDVSELLSTWKEIEHEASRQNAPCLLYQDMGLLGKVLRDELDEFVTEIVTDSEEEFYLAQKYVERFCNKESLPHVSLHRGKIPLFEMYGIENELSTALDRKVWLGSGAYLVIDQTEALTVIDVNTGKYVGDKDLRRTVLKTNIEAAEEIARQLRLRAIGGIVVVDFIDMGNEEDQHALLERLEEVFKNDRCKAKVFGLTQLGLVELTRKRARSDMRATFTRGCPFCGGTGQVLREEAISASIKRFLRKVVKSSAPEAILLEASSAIADFIHGSIQKQWEEQMGIKLFIMPNSKMAWDKYRIEAQGNLQQVLHRVNLLKEREAGCVVYRTDPA
ncbi:Rne/Rng family ribonuclease [Thermovirga sp.]|uniref:Rne/Rng family ribonuclease n=1 Tax=Thermovirga sp. TaxID=2699834 RepID=UPI0025EDC547|nr:Rne/Rng family ribonuclease [Thermovirga sp.]MBO8154171.1 Rne/Rng family ribonuclease [Thermovirga sp.]